MSAIGQNESYSVAIDWREYLSGTSQISFAMPKVPVVSYDESRCLTGPERTYGSYADGVGFVVREKFPVSRTKSYCELVSRRDGNNLTERLAYLKSGAFKRAEVSADEVDTIFLVGDSEKIKIFHDKESGRWIEMLAFGEISGKKEVDRYFASLKTGKNATGTEIGRGAERTLGDPVPVNAETVKPAADVRPAVTETPENTGSETAGRKNTNSNATGGGNPETGRKDDGAVSGKWLRGVVILMKPELIDPLRENGVKGRVLLRVTFLANGGMGAITVISGSPFGRTEAAISAAKGIVFLPAVRNGVKETVTKNIEYSFGSY